MAEDILRNADGVRHERVGDANIVCAMFDRWDGGCFSTRLLLGIERGISETDSACIVCPCSSEAELQKTIAGGRVRGIVLLLSDLTVKDLMDRPSEETSFGYPVPVVTLFFAVPGMDLVTVNEHEAMYAMGRYLARYGHHHVAFVGPESQLARARLEGLRAGLDSMGVSMIDDDVRMKRFAMIAMDTVPLVQDLMKRRQALPESERFTAIAVYNDYMALIVIRCLREEYGLRVPEGISVTGFDGGELVLTATPKLTTMEVPLAEVGAEAGRVLLWRVRNQGEPLQRVMLAASLFEGGTVWRNKHGAGA